MKLLSEFFSDDGQRTATVFDNDGEFSVVCLDTSLQAEHKFFFSFKSQAEDFAEEWVMRENAPL